MTKIKEKIYDQVSKNDYNYRIKPGDLGRSWHSCGHYFITICFITLYYVFCGRPGGLMVVQLSLDREVWVSALGRDTVLCSWVTEFILSACLHQGVQMDTDKFYEGVTLQWTSIPSRQE